ncbi:TPA: prepilin peptidase [Candidatus Woesearchaeota archaeon]|nr:hypothetical protein [archaeon]HIJ10682.1 prepilin peptidase [Candidatus Woesearchaeota archaeon]|tara:strand:- start:260 stop:1081 length:822 start_codon:yes stop_codon:yes gene_type:complete
MLNLILIPLTLVTLIAASYTDIRTREVPDWLNYSLIAGALGVRFIFSIEQGWHIFVEGLLGFGIFFGLALLFYHTNQWGGGDAKLLMGTGAVIGFSLPFSEQSLLLFWYFMLLLLVGSLWGLLFMIGIAMKQRVPLLSTLTKQKTLNISTLVFTALLLITSLFIPLFLILVPMPIFFYVLLTFVQLVEERCFKMSRPVSKLVEGDWLEKDVVVKGKTLLTKRTLEKKDLVFLKKHHVKEVFIKEGVPFVPGFLFAYVVFLFGDRIFPYVLSFF